MSFIRPRSKSGRRARYAQLPYESDGIRDPTYPPGDFRRYAGSTWNDGVTVWENGEFDVWKANQMVPGAQGYMPRGLYDSGISWRAAFDGAAAYHEKGATYTGTVHPIASGTQATATGTMSAGAVNSITMVDKGAGYFKPPFCTARGAGLTGVTLTPVMEAAAVDMYLRRGNDHAVGDTLTFTGGITATVATIQGTGATGPIATLTLANRGTLADPSVTTKDTANRFVQTGSTGAGTGVHILLSFRVASVTITSGGSGGPGSCTVLIDPPMMTMRLEGEITSYGRLGVQGASPEGIYVEAFHGKSDATINFDGKRNPGIHIDYNINFEFGTFIVDDVGDQSGFAGWAGVSIDGLSWRPAKAVKGKLIRVLKSDNNGVGIAAEVDIDTIRVDSFGCGSSVTSTQYFGPGGANSEGKALYLYRWLGRIGNAVLGQNDQTIGSVAQYHLLCASTGLGDTTTLPMFNYADNTSGGTQYNNRGAVIENVALLNVSRKGGLSLCDRNNADSTVGCSLTVGGRVLIQPSAVTAMTANYSLLHLNANASSAQIRTTLTAQEIRILGQGTGGQGSQPGIFTAANTFLNVNHIHHPYHGSGKLLDCYGVVEATLYADGDSNYGMGSSSDAIALLTGSDVAGSKLEVIANCNSGNIARGVVDLTNVRDVSVEVISDRYRNASLVKLTGSTATVTISNASPGILTFPSAHNLKPGATVVLSTTGALPTGLSAATTYYVAHSPAPTSTTLALATTWGGTAINTSSAGSGTHTAAMACERVRLSGRLNGLNGTENGLLISGRLIDSALRDLRMTRIGATGVKLSSATLTRVGGQNVYIDDCGTATTEITVGTIIGPVNCTGLEV